MNNFAKIILVQRFKKVNYYTLKLEEDELSLFGQFQRKHTAENRDKLNHILAWIKVIGNKIGAKKDHFRPEENNGSAVALPPIGKDKEPTYVEFNDETGKDENTPNNLRLYCYRLGDNVVFLFNGDIKTAETAQECDNVRPHFKLANELTNVLDKAIGNGFKLNKDYTDLEIDNDFELNW